MINPSPMILLPILLISQSTHSFTIRNIQPRSKITHQSTPFLHRRSSSNLHNLPPSKVIEDDEPTPPPVNDPIPVIDVNDIVEIQYNASDHPIPDQPWRRGDTDGCEDPIDVWWRKEAEVIIEDAIDSIGGDMLGVTWFMAKCVVTVDPDTLCNVLHDTEGHRIIHHYDQDENSKNYDPRSDWVDWQDDPEMLQKEERHKYNLPIEHNVYADFNPNNMHNQVDTDAISSLAKAITEALEVEEVEERLKVLSRHELILSTPPPNGNGMGGSYANVSTSKTSKPDGGVLETQVEFDMFLGFDVSVRTHDPWNSNRTLKGKLVSRDALDVKIDVDGNVVTIPLNFVNQVALDPNA
mmetsp:Transcript_21600/g.31629  ORF Transcript_21600/g.31629 Transcript_21600/m.31629 type:complete len:352 (+) Transcript_21600:157-1212(+)|eukprot:CAMPEP_0195508456 /NCGR_PEP_ID=MMETSP0794_2-20130614/1655_1 /TAXON_ID=515487 /ORGANISM="Stephanopyxis turris, Strain CCMP 815" /LENGTH=351 /DNA_ID=CAMNT_0040635419 /DNA_START=112 /DNA_END=1167 /DNA_ORIENTATION=+